MPPRCDDLINELLHFRRVRLGAKNACEPRHVLFLSVCPHVPARLLLDGFP